MSQTAEPGDFVKNLEKRGISAEEAYGVVYRKQSSQIPIPSFLYFSLDNFPNLYCFNDFFINNVMDLTDIITNDINKRDILVVISDTNNIINLVPIETKLDRIARTQTTQIFINGYLNSIINRASLSSRTDSFFKFNNSFVKVTEDFYSANRSLLDHDDIILLLV